MPAWELSVIVPAYNEAATIRTVLDAVAAAPYRKQIVVVDDGSTDGTAAVVQAWVDAGGPGAELICHPANRGKGAAVRTGLARCRGAVTLVQDADLEYDPTDYPALVAPILAGDAEVVYGSRYLGPTACPIWTTNRVGVSLLNLLIRVLYGVRLTDEATGYKAFRTDLIRGMDLRCERFEFCPEVTAKTCRMGLDLREVPVRYSPRSIRQGKKIRWWDGLEAISTLLRWRLAPFHPTRFALDPAGEGPTPGLDAGAVPSHPRLGGEAVELSVVIPAYNEAQRLPAYLADIRDHLDRTLPDAYEVIVVDDGSRDGTADRLAELGQSWPQLSAVTHPANRGKGAAVRTGMLVARGRLTLFTDADGATPIVEEAALRRAIDAGADLAVASRLAGAPAIDVHRSRLRDLYGRIFARLARSVAGITVRDPQCGFKMFRGRAARRLFGPCREQGYLFDLHVLGLAARLGLQVVEVPVPWREVPGSKVRPLRDATRMVLGLSRLRWELDRLAEADAADSLGEGANLTLLEAGSR